MSSSLDAQFRQRFLQSNDSDSDVEFSFEGANLKPGRLDRYGRPVPLKALRSTNDAPEVLPADAPDGTEAPLVALAPIQVKVTPYVPKKNVERMRDRSWHALQEARRDIERETGQPPRLIVEPTSGMLLPRDQVLGEEIVATARDVQRQHYARSIQVLDELREERMMRFFKGT